MPFQQQTLEHVEAVVENLENEKWRLERRIARARALPERQVRRVARLEKVRVQLSRYQRVLKCLKRSAPSRPAVSAKARPAEPAEVGSSRRGYLFE